MKLVFLLPFLLFSTLSIAQNSIYGKVVDEYNTPVSYVNIILQKDSVKIFSTLTDSIGEYKFDKIINGKYLIVLNHLNFTKKILFLELNKDTTLKTQLHTNSIILNKVIVKSYLPLIQRKADRFVIIPNKTNSNGDNIFEILKHTPMLQYTANNDVFSILNKSETTIYFNNKKSNLPKEMIVEMLKSLPSENIKNIEIITSPGSEYPAQTNGGIININIKRQLEDGWLGNITINSQQGVYNTTLLNGSINFRKKNFTFQIIPTVNNSYNYKTIDNKFQYVNLINENINSNYYRRYNVFGCGLNFDYEIDNKNIISYTGWLSSVVGNSNNKSITRYTENDLFKTDSLFNSLYKNNDKFLYNFGNINYHKKFNSARDKYLDLSLDYNQFNQENIISGIFNTLYQDGEIESGKYKNQLPQKFINISEKIEYSNSVNKNLTTKIGLQISTTNVLNNSVYSTYNYSLNKYEISYDLSNYNEYYTSGFFNINKDFGSKISTSLGLRIEKTKYNSSVKRSTLINNDISIDTSYINLFPSMSFSYILNNSNQFSVEFSKKISRPKFELLSPGINYINSNYITQNNPFLQPIIYYNYEAIYALKNKYFFVFNYSNINNSFENFTLPVTINNQKIIKNTFLNYGTQNSISFSINANVTLFKDIWVTQIVPLIDYSSYNIVIPEINTNIYNFHYNLVVDNTIFISKKNNITAFMTYAYNSKFKNASQSQLNSTSHFDFGFKKSFHDKISILFFVNDLFNDNSETKSLLISNPIFKTNFYNQNIYSRSITLTMRYKFGNYKIKKLLDRKIANNEVKNRTGN